MLLKGTAWCLGQDPCSCLQTKQGANPSRPGSGTPQPGLIYTPGPVIVHLGQGAQKLLGMRFILVILQNHEDGMYLLMRSCLLYPTHFQKRGL